MIRVFYDEAAADLPADAPALGVDHFENEADAAAWVAEHGHVRAAWSSIGAVADFVDNGEAWTLLDGTPRRVRIEQWRAAAERLTRERDAIRRHLTAAVSQAIALRDEEHQRAEAERARADVGDRDRRVLCAEMAETEAALKAAGAPTWHEADDRPLTSAEQATAIAARAVAAEKRLADLRAWAEQEARKWSEVFPDDGPTSWDEVVGRIDGKEDT